MFSSTKLKIIALIFMLIDHIGEFIPKVPVYFRWIGRISAPLFLFCMVWGLHYTHNRKIYLIRMYICGVLMGIMDLILNNLFLKPYSYVTNNIFVTLFLVGAICTIFDIRKEDKKRGNKLLGIFIIFQAIGTVLCKAASHFHIITLSRTLGALSANLLSTEGGIFFVVMGMLLYYSRENKVKLSIIYIISCIFIFIIELLNSKGIRLYMLYKNYQWMMIGALPFMCLYNNQKGKGFKYLFYTFYPAHIFILFWIGNAYFKHWFN